MKMQSNSEITYKVQVTLALGRPDKTWIEHAVVIDAPAGFDDMDDYPLAERAFDHMMQHEADQLNAIAPSFWVVLHYEVLE
jgi:hypothetical protein